MSRQLLPTLRLACASATLIWAGPALAESLAILIGVSGYPSLAPGLRLRGPANDVRLMGAILARLGLPASRVRVLADGVAGSSALPTKSNILASLDRAANEVRSGDWVVVYFSGHGSQQPQGPKRANDSGDVEPDGLDEIFLPYDIGRWNGALGSVDGALVDDEIGVALSRIGSRGAEVWAIFDTCHAGDMGKMPPSLSFHGEALPPVYRYVNPADLGVETPRSRIEKRPEASATSSSSAATDSRNQVLFYAARPNEPAAEEVAPDPTQARVLSLLPAPRLYYGVFTYELHRAVMAKPLASFADLAHAVGEAYQSRPFPTPQFEGPLYRFPKLGGRPDN